MRAVPCIAAPPPPLTTIAGALAAGLRELVAPRAILWSARGAPPTLHALATPVGARSDRRCVLPQRSTKLPSGRRAPSLQCQPLKHLTPSGLGLMIFPTPARR